MPGTERRKAQAASFGAAAATYERARPSYPDEAIGWLLPPGARRVLDLGAGTGKLTRGLVGRGLGVVAVEPSAGMRDQLARVLPGVTVLAGTAEEIPLADHAVDAVLVAQAWHWVDPARAVPEAARVLAPGGRLGLLWNIRDERADWVAELGTTARPRRSGPHSRSDQVSEARRGRASVRAGRTVRRRVGQALPRRTRSSSWSPRAATSSRCRRPSGRPSCPACGTCSAPIQTLPGLPRSGCRT